MLWWEWLIVVVLVLDLSSSLGNIALAIQARKKGDQ